MTSPNYFTPTIWAWVKLIGQVKLRTSTDKPCRAYLWYSKLPPTKRAIYRPVRGLQVFCGWSYSFWPQWVYEQEEPGNTITHTYEPLSWPEGSIGYWTLSYFDNTGVSKSQIPVITTAKPETLHRFPLVSPSAIYLPGSGQVTWFFPGEWTNISGWYALMGIDAPSVGCNFFEAHDTSAAGWEPSPVGIPQYLDIFPPYDWSVPATPCGSGVKNYLSYPFNVDSDWFLAINPRNQTLNVLELGYIA